MIAFLDRHRVVAHDLDRDVVGQRAVHQHLDLMADVFGHLDGVGALGLDHVDRKRRFAVQKRDALGLGLAVDQGGDVAQAHRLAAAARDDDVEKVGRVLDPAFDLDRLHRKALFDRARRQVLVVLPEGCGDLADADAEGAEPVGVDQHVELARDAADHRGAPDPLDRRHPRFDHVFGERGQVAQRHGLRADRERHDRKLGRVELEQERIVGIVGKRRLDRAQPVAHLLHRGGAVDIHLEEQDHQRLAGARGALDVVDAADRVHRFLDRLDDVAFHRLGGGAGIAHHHGDDREVDVRQLLDRQALEGIDADDHEGGHDHRREDRGVDADAGQEHALTPPRSRRRRRL